MPQVPFNQMLKQIVDYLNEESDDAMRLWDVLSALRGPDSGNQDIFEAHRIKTATTSVIRHAIKLRADNIQGVVVVQDDQNSLKLRCELDTFKHFAVHATKAFTALELNWFGVNNEKNVQEGE